MKEFTAYLKNLQFSRMLIKYFLLLFIILVMPVTVINSVYQTYQEKIFEQRMIEKNEESLLQVYNSANSVFVAAKNLLYSIAHQSDVQYLAIKDSVDQYTNKTTLLAETFEIIKKSNDPVDSIAVWFSQSDQVISNQGLSSLEDYADRGWEELYEGSMEKRIVHMTRKKNGVYPYLLTFLYPITGNGKNHFGAAIVNVDLERLGEYLGTGRYQTKDDASTLLIFENENGNLIYSDEYRLWQQETQILENLWQMMQENESSRITSFEGTEYIVSTRLSKEGFLYAYLSPALRVENEMSMITDIYQKTFWISVLLCAVVAYLFARWIYRPIRKTRELLDGFSSLVGWDEKDGLDEIESIQRDILHIKEYNDTQDEVLKERMLSLHNAQICALQTQINPHFLYNCLESIGNLTAIMMGENNVTEAIYTLGKLMRISLSGKNYLVPLEEELEHVSIYIRLMELIEPEFRKRVHVHMDIPSELKKERIIKLTLQPIIENALEHGLSGKRREGNIWISGEIREDKNYLYIMDDGVGMNEEQITALRESLKESSIVSSRHIGLKNVNQRIQLVFGEEYGLTVDQKKQFVVTVTFKSL